jgi:hypothetical protein
MANRKNWFDKVGAKDKSACEGDCQALEFTHGIEVECFLVDKKGEKLTHSGFGKVYNSMMTRDLVRNINRKIPKFYKDKVSDIDITSSKSSTYDALKIGYQVEDDLVVSELVSVDRNVAEWPLIEIATPPCESLYELGWWSSAVFRLVMDALKENGNGNQIMIFGVNPYETTQEIVSSETFPTCGEHHHIKVVRSEKMTQEESVFFTNFYHLVRFFASHLILLSACSPFASGGLWGRYRSDDPQLPFPRCVRSIRVLYNKKHLCSFQDGEYLPYLDNGWRGQKYFVDEFKKQSNSFRTDTHFFDVDPLSKENKTMEIRFFDSQPSIARRVGLAALIQVLARKAQKLVAEDEDNLLEVIKESNTNLQRLKKMACEGGLWFRPPSKPILGENVKLKPSGIDRIIFSDLLLEMLFFLRGELRERNLIYSHFLDPIRHTIFDLGGNGISPAQYWLITYIKENQDMGRVAKRILDSSQRSTDMWYDPIIDDPVHLEDLNLEKNKGD